MRRGSASSLHPVIPAQQRVEPSLNHFTITVLLLTRARSSSSPGQKFPRARALPMKSRFLLSIAVLIFFGANLPATLSAADNNASAKNWIGTWAASPQPVQPGQVKIYRNQSLRLIVHTSIGGAQVRIKLSNIYGEQPVVIGAAHLARRTTEAEIDPASDRAVKFSGQISVTVPAGAMVVSDPVELAVPALADLAVSLFLPESTEVKTAHTLAKQTSYISAETGDSTAEVKFPVAKKTGTWPFLTGVDVVGSTRGGAIVAFGSSLTDGDGTTTDTNGRWPDVLAARLLKADSKVELGVLNEGIIGNRLLNDIPLQALGGKFGAVLGEAGVKRFERDVLSQTGVKYVVVGLGINDIAFPGSLTPANDAMTVESLVAGYRQLIARAHQKGIRIIGTTNAPFENAFLALAPPASPITFFTPEKESVRQKVNEWILRSGEFDGTVDLDKLLRDPNRPTQILPSYDSGDHLHPNNAGCLAEGNAFPLVLFGIN